MIIKKIGLIFFGILLIMVFELSLLLTGKIFLYARGFYSPIDSNKVDKLILCIGDSHTFGVGTSCKYSYPNQLEALLNLNNQKSSFKVTNLGIPGNSTKRQIDRLETFLNKNKADLAILLTGRNNYYEITALQNKSFLPSIIIWFKTLKTYKIMQYIFHRFFKIGIWSEDINSSSGEIDYENYMKSQLTRVKGLCERHGCKLILLSYYNSHNECIEKIAGQLGILYFNVYQDFSKIATKENLNKFVSSDMSHMNLYGYKVFAELLYKKMYLRREALSLKLKPLTKKIDNDSYSQNPATYYLKYLQGKSVFY